MERKLCSADLWSPKWMFGTSKAVPRPQWNPGHERLGSGFLHGEVSFTWSSSFVPQHQEMWPVRCQQSCDTALEQQHRKRHRKIHRKIPFLSLWGCKVLWRGTEHPVGGELLATVLRWGQAAGRDGLKAVCPSLCQHLGAVGHLQLQQGGAQSSALHCLLQTLFALLSGTPTKTQTIKKCHP